MPDGVPPRPRGRVRFRVPVLAVMLSIVSAAAPSGPPAAAARGGQERLDRVERRLVRLINRLRAQHHLPALRTDRRLHRSADFHSRDMLRHGYFAHASRDGTPTSARVRRFRPAGATGETLAQVPARPRHRQAGRVLNLWLASPGHRRVLLGGSYTRIGIGRRTGALHGVHGTLFTANLQSAR